MDKKSVFFAPTGSMRADFVLSGWFPMMHLPTDKVSTLGQRMAYGI